MRIRHDSVGNKAIEFGIFRRVSRQVEEEFEEILEDRRPKPVFVFSNFGKKSTHETTSEYDGIQIARSAIDDGALDLVVDVERRVRHLLLQVTLKIDPVSVARIRKDVQEEGTLQQSFFLQNLHQIRLYPLIHVVNTLGEEHKSHRGHVVNCFIALGSTSRDLR